MTFQPVLQARYRAHRRTIDNTNALMPLFKQMLRGFLATFSIVRANNISLGITQIPPQTDIRVLTIGQ